NFGPAIPATRTQAGEGEAPRLGVDYTDPLALAKQSTNGRISFRSSEGGEDTAGFRTWRGFQWTGVSGPFRDWMLTRGSSHLWRADLPETLPIGVHRLEVQTTDRYGRSFSEVLTFEVVEDLPAPEWPFGDDF
ncbi:MAG: hypothetical protein AAFV49_18915, partial [Pseudomonadota bacterium]